MPCKPKKSTLRASMPASSCCRYAGVGKTKPSTTRNMTGNAMAHMSETRSRSAPLKSIRKAVNIDLFLLLSEIEVKVFQRAGARAGEQVRWCSFCSHMSRHDQHQAVGQFAHLFHIM